MIHFEPIKFRFEALKQLPAWLRGFYGTRLIYSIFVAADALADAALAAVEIRFPNVYSNESLGLIGRHRRMVRGPGETDDGYAAQLVDYRQVWARAGNRLIILEQLRAYLAPNPFPMAIIDNDGTRWHMADDGTVTIDTSQTWNWDGHTEYVSRFWVALWPPSGWSASGGNIGAITVPAGDSLGQDPGETLGSTTRLEVVETVRSIIESLRDPGSHCENIIVILDNGSWSDPDGTWDHPSRRSHAARYWRCS